LVPSQLEKALTFNDDILPICLPTAHERPQKNKKALVAGWGSTGGEKAIAGFYISIGDGRPLSGPPKVFMIKSYT